MSLRRSPSFQFYASNWLGSRAVRLMDAEQRGWYIQLLAEAWENDPQATLPDDDTLLRRLAGVDSGSTSVDSGSTSVEARWAAVKALFKKRGTLLVNVRLAAEYDKQRNFHSHQSFAGRASAAARRRKQQPVISQQHSGTAPVPTEDEPEGEPEPNREATGGAPKGKFPIPIPTPTPTEESVGSLERINNHSGNGRAQTARATPAQSKFDLETIRSYAWESHQYHEWLRGFDPKSKLEGIRNPEGWAVVAHRTGEFDQELQEFVDDPEMFVRQRREATEARR